MCSRNVAVFFMNTYSLPPPSPPPAQQNEESESVLTRDCESQKSSLLFLRYVTFQLQAKYLVVVNICA